MAESTGLRYGRLEPIADQELIHENDAPDTDASRKKHARQR